MDAEQLRTIIREELEPIEKNCQRTDEAIRGTNDTPGLTTRVSSLEQSRSISKKLWGGVMAVIVAAFSALASKVFAND